MQPEANRSRRILAGLIAIGASVAALYLTLFPFDFFAREPLSLQAILARFDVNFISRYTVKDFPRNILLFVPIGFGLYPLLTQRWPRLLRLMMVLLAGAVLSFLIEVGQIFLYGRFTAVADVLANTIGAGVGALLATVVGERVLSLAARLLEWINRVLSPIRAAALLMTWIALLLILLSAEQNRAQISNWTPMAPLLVANEAGGDRQWQGSVAGFYLAPHALDAAEIAQVFATDAPLVPAPAQSAAHYALQPAGIYRDPSGHWPDLMPQTQPDGARWWQSAVAPVALNRAISAANAFTLVADLRSAGPEQTGPARIISLSTSIWERNLTLGQEGTDLVVRLRNGVTDLNGRYPSLVLHNVFADTQMQRIVVIYDTVTLRMYVDSANPAGTFRFTPAQTLFVSRPPVEISEVSIAHLQTWIYQLLFTGFIYVPVGLLLFYATPRRSALRVQTIILLSGVLVAAFLLEGGMAYARRDGLDGSGIALGVAWGMAAGGLMLRHSRKHHGESSAAVIDAAQLEMQTN